MAKATGIDVGRGAVALDVSHPPELPAYAPEGTVKQAKERMKSLASEVKDRTRKVAEQARGQVQELVEDQKEQAAAGLGSVAEALREAGRKLEEKDPNVPLGRYADRAAGQVDRLSTYLREHDLSDAVHDVKELTRRRPALVLGGSFLAGLMLARFLTGSRSGSAQRGA
jgi:hypothetical protein